ncbi:branched-chain amino acid aminotransferase [Rhodoligotrophos appendicifer]|uniref:aminotransferase class IV n=1 Tax=Rhodoligotrophos appendicifer TaxID=987056 RepID=UPI0011865731|nr:aminotransferase class IV [Rhodoligotrophos appendicifer]
MQISIDGRLVDQAAAGLSVLDRGFTLGDGVFETLGVRGREILRLDAHLRRLRQGLAVLRLPVKMPDFEFVTRLLSVIAVNDLTEGSLRLTVTRGQGPRGLLPPDAPVPSVVITAAPFAPRATEISVIISEKTRRNEFSPLSNVKALGYLDNILALMNAREHGADDALLLNSRGHVVAGTAANLFAVIDKVLVTPPLADGALPGVTRAEIIERTKAEERSLTPDMLAQADEVILTNSLGLRSVISLNGQPLGAGRSGAAAAAIKAQLAFPGD